MIKCDSILSTPGLRKFDISAKEIYEDAYVASGSKLSNSCFLHRICWNVLFEYSYHVSDNCICLVADDNKINRAHIVYPIGQFTNYDLTTIVKYWIKIFRKYNKPFQIEFIDEVGLFRLCKCMEDEGILWRPRKCVDCFDYIYDISDYINLKGRKNKDKRRFWNHYLENIDSYRLEQIGPKNVNVCQYITEIWESQKGLSKNDLINTDHYPLGFFWEHIDEIDNCSYILYRNKCAIAFFIASINDTCCTFHFAKSDRTYPEANFLLHHLFLKYYCPKEIKTLNFEDDMGDLNIRRYKSHVACGRMLEKYSLEVVN